MTRDRVFKMSRATALATSLILLLAVAAGCGGNNSTGPNYGGGGGPAPTPGLNQVWQQNIAFNPSSMTVTHGTTVTWMNKDGITHTVTSGTPGHPDGRFGSGNMAPGASFQFTFATAGTYPYYCSIHGAAMTGTIIVQ